MSGAESVAVAIKPAIKRGAMTGPSGTLQVPVQTEPRQEKISVRNLNFYYEDSNRALIDISVPIYAHSVTAFFGPSGCGKSTLLRVFNRIYDLYHGQRVEGEVMLDGENILLGNEDLPLLRARIGMVFQKPTPFPMSIYQNIAFGIGLYRKLSRRELDAEVELALRRAALWDEVKNNLAADGLSSFGRSAAAPVHRPRHRDPARSASSRRALLRDRPDFVGEDRGDDRGIEAGSHDRNRDAQPATGSARLRLCRLRVSRPTGRVRDSAAHVYEPKGSPDKEFHHGSLRLRRLRGIRVTRPATAAAVVCPLHLREQTCISDVSALPQEADITLLRRHVRLVPKADLVGPYRKAIGPFQTRLVRVQELLVSRAAARRHRCRNPDRRSSCPARRGRKAAP